MLDIKNLKIADMTEEEEEAIRAQYPIEEMIKSLKAILEILDKKSKVD